MMSIVAAGCGGAFAEVLSTPGVSKVLKSMHFPYSYEEVKKACTVSDGDQNFKALSSATAYRLSLSNLLCDIKPEYNDLTIGITAGLITSRYRKGEEVAYIVVRDTKHFLCEIKIEFNKLSEESYNQLDEKGIKFMRKMQDEIIKNVALHAVLCIIDHVSPMTIANIAKGSSRIEKITVRDIYTPLLVWEDDW